MTDNIVQGALFTMMVMRVGDASGAALEQTLRNQITRSPQFFANAPIVLDLKGSGGGGVRHAKCTGDESAVHRARRGFLEPVRQRRGGAEQVAAHHRAGPLG